MPELVPSVVLNSQCDLIEEVALLSPAVCKAIADLARDCAGRLRQAVWPGPA